MTIPKNQNQINQNVECCDGKSKWTKRNLERSQGIDKEENEPVQICTELTKLYLNNFGYGKVSIVQAENKFPEGSVLSL